VTIPIRRELRVAFELPELLRSQIFREPPPAPERGLPVLLVTGVYANDATMRPMAVWLRRMGYAPKRAGLRFNAACSEAEMGRLEMRLERAAQRTGRRAAIVGWSRGGLFARALAVRRPDLVSGIVALGSPLLNPLGYVHPFLHLALEATSTLGDRGVPGLLSHRCADEWALDGADDPNPLSRALIERTRRLLAEGDRCCERFWQDIRAPFPQGIPFVSVYSKTDAIVNWQACLDPAARQLEVDASHCGMGVSRHVFRALAVELERIAALERSTGDGRALAA
jgi:pimeloyl-ACP methyl ester carboxylesterase